MHPFMSQDWVRACIEAFISNKDSLKKPLDLTATVKFYVEDQEGRVTRAIELRLQEGELVYAGDVRSEHFDYEVGAKAEVWRDIATGKVGPRFALITKRLKFKGDLVNLIKHEESLQELFKIFSQVPTQWEE